LVDWKDDPGSTEMLIQEHMVLGEIRFTMGFFTKWHHQIENQVYVIMVNRTPTQC